MAQDSNSTTPTASTASTARQVPIGLRIWLKLYLSFVAVAQPLFDLAARLLIAQFFFRSGAVKLADWETALYLATNEYPVSWISPHHAAVTGVAIEVGGAILLALGLATRGVALALAALLLVSQVEYVAVDLNLFICAMLGWYLLRGAGGLSLDHAMAAGLGGSALPLATAIVRGCAWVSKAIAPLWLIVVRGWLAVALLAAAGLETIADTSGAIPFLDPTWFPITSFAAIPSGFALIFGTLLLVGLAVPWAMLVLVFMSASAMAMGDMGLAATPILFATLLFGLLGFYGAGRFSIDAQIRAWLDKTILCDQYHVPENWPHIVVVGAGFGGLTAVRALRLLPVRITLIDRRNYHLFQPLLYQVATAALSPADVAIPIRSMFRGDGNVRVLLGAVDAVDPKKKQIYCGEKAVDYDYLLLATGASHSYFGKDEWAPYAPGLKTIEDGVSVRAHVLRAFEHAEACDDPAEIERLMTFAIIGAGPTGVELAGAIAELARLGLRQEYRRIDPAKARILLVQSADRVLPVFPEQLSHHAAQSLEKIGVEIIVSSRVTDIGADYIRIGAAERIACGTVLWAAGVVASDASDWLGAEKDRAGRVMVDDYLRVRGFEDIFAIGDTAHSLAWEGNPVPGLAPAAKQAGDYFARYIARRILKKQAVAPFRYRHQGSLATIGRKSAVADFGIFKMHGALAWWLWGAVHVGFLTGVRNRMSVILNWIWSYLTYGQAIRLITEPSKLSLQPELAALRSSETIAETR